MIPQLALGALGAAALFYVAVSRRPGPFRVARSATIAAPAEVVFAQLEDFRAWRAWSPWEDLDPDLRRTYGGPASGAGATYHWTGNRQVGEGNMEITESEPPRRLALRIAFIRPIATSNDIEFTLTPAAGATDAVTVTWTMTGDRNFMMKAFSLVMDMDTVVGRDFEKGLARLKAVSEASRATG